LPLSAVIGGVDKYISPQMVIKKQEGETRKERRRRQIRTHMVYNDWGLYGFVRMLAYKCLRFGKAL
jgi:transposase